MTEELLLYKKAIRHYGELSQIFGNDTAIKMFKAKKLRRLEKRINEGV